MSELVIKGLTATVAGTDILRGVDLTISSGEVHAVMGPNGAGKSTLSHVLLGKPGYEVTGGSVTLDGEGHWWMFTGADDAADALIRHWDSAS